MSENITPFAISAPGFYGLNLSDSPVDLSTNFALEANNCVIDKSGRVSSRKGWTKANTASVDLSTNDVRCIGELIQNDGTATTLVAGGGKILKLSAGALVNLTYGGGGSAPTIAANDWKFCQLNGIAMFWQRGYDPLIYDPVVSTTTYRRLSEKSGSLGTVYQCNEAISAYGRVWSSNTTTDKNTVVWSDMLTPHIWTTGTSGSLDLRQIWPMGGDEVIALAAHNNFLFIFGRKQILIYQNANTPEAMSLNDSITGIGCIARDSVQYTGEDVIFLSDSGVRSLMRTIQEKSAPTRNLSKNVHDDIQTYVTNESGVIKSGYSALNQFYLLALPDARKTYCFDLRTTLQDGSARTTIWTGLVSTSFCETKGRKFYLGKPGYLGEYSGNLDDTATYRMSYYTTWIDFGNPIMTSILKKLFVTLIGGANQSVVFKWAYDFKNYYFSDTAILNGYPTAAEYGLAEYGSTWEYTTGIVVDTIHVNGSSSGKILQFGFEMEINNSAISVQKIELFTKDGKY